MKKHNIREQIIDKNLEKITWSSSWFEAVSFEAESGFFGGARAMRASKRFLVGDISSLSSLPSAVFSDVLSFCASCVVSVNKQL